MLFVPAAHAADAKAVDAFTGDWHGSYFAHPYAVDLRLSLRSAGGNKLEGTASIAQLVETRTIGGDIKGSFSVRGVCDPATQTFTLAPVRWIDKPQRALVLPTLTGVRDPSSEQLAGTFVMIQRVKTPPQIYFSLARPNEAKAIVDPVKFAFNPASVQQGGSNPPRVRGPGTRIRQPVAPAPRLTREERRAQRQQRNEARLEKQANFDKAVLAWGERFRKEHPKISPSGTEMGGLFAYGYSMFEDELFKAHFGQRFDEMSAADMADWRKTFSNTTNREVTEWSGFSQAFVPGAMSHGAVSAMQALMAQRVLRRWRDARIADVKAVPLEVASFGAIDAIDKASDQQLGGLWPSERAELRELGIATRRTIAEPIARNRADEAVANAKGYDGAVMLSRWRSDNSVVLTWTPDDVANELYRKIDRRLGEIVKPLIEAEVARIASIDDGANGLLESADWYRHFRGKYAFAGKFQAYSAAIRVLRKKRDGQLADIEPRAIAVIEQMGVKSEVSGFVAWLLPVPGDRESPAGRRIVAAGAKRIEAIRLREQQQVTGALLSLATLFVDNARFEAEEQGDTVGAVMLAVLRGHLIDGAIRNFFPDFTDDAVAYLRIRIGLALDGELFDEDALDDEERREELLDEFREQYPDQQVAAEAFNTLWETVKRYERKQERQRTDKPAP